MDPSKHTSSVNETNERTSTLPQKSQNSMDPNKKLTSRRGKVAHQPDVNPDILLHPFPYIVLLPGGNEAHNIAMYLLVKQ